MTPRESKGELAVGAEKKQKADNRQGSLSFRQYRAIALMLDGHTNKEVRAKLGISCLLYTSDAADE